MKKLPLCLLPFLLAAGCATPPHYADPTEARTRSLRYTDYDLQQDAIVMVDSMLASESLKAKVRRQFGDKVPTITLGRIANETEQTTLGLSALGDAIATRLINADLFDYIDSASMGQMAGAVMSAAGNPLVAPQNVIQPGQGESADYIVTGSLLEIRDQGGRTRERVYRLTLRLNNLRTLKTDWQDEKVLRKESTRAGLGW